MNKQILDLYTDYLISSFSQTTATGLSRLLDGAITHDVVTNFLTEEQFTAKDLWKLVKKEVRQIESDDGCLIFDDSIVEKPSSSENEIVCYHWDHCKNRSVKGMNLLNCLYYSQEARVPISYEIIRKDEKYLDPKTNKVKRKSSVSKNELLRTMLQAVRQTRVKFRYVLTDIWFAAAENMTFIKKKLKKDFIMAMKSNRSVTLSLKDKKQGRFVSIDSLRIQEGETLRIYLKGLDFPVLLTKKVFINKDASEGILYLVSSDLSLDYDQIQSLYQKRWCVEEFHQSIKSNTGLAKSPTRTVRTQSNHFFASIYAFVKLERLRTKAHLNHYALKSKLYLKALKASFEELHKMNAQFCCEEHAPLQKVFT